MGTVQDLRDHFDELWSHYRNQEQFDSNDPEHFIHFALGHRIVERALAAVDGQFSAPPPREYFTQFMNWATETYIHFIVLTPNNSDQES